MSASTTATVAPGAPRSAFDVLLRDPDEACRRCLTGRDVVPLARIALLSVLAGGAMFGAVLGSYRGELQVPFAAVKMPLVLLATLVVTAPALWALGASSGRTWTMRAAASLVLVAAGRAALVLVALAPLLWLAIDLGAGYHFSSFLAAIVFGLGGLCALSTLVGGLGGASRLGSALLAACVFVAALSQAGWVLRPWLGRPSVPVAFFRTEPGHGALGSVVESARLGWIDPTGSSIEGVE